MKKIIIIAALVAGCGSSQSLVSENHPRVPLPNGRFPEATATETPEESPTPTPTAEPSPTPTPAPACGEGKNWLCHRPESNEVPFPCNWMCLADQPLNAHLEQHEKDMAPEDPTSCMQCHN